MHAVRARGQAAYLKAVQVVGASCLTCSRPTPHQHTQSTESTVQYTFCLLLCSAGASAVRQGRTRHRLLELKRDPTAP